MEKIHYFYYIKACQVITVLYRKEGWAAQAFGYDAGT